MTKTVLIEQKEPMNRGKQRLHISNLGAKITLFFGKKMFLNRFLVKLTKNPEKATFLHRK